MLTPKENALKLFKHEKTEYIPSYGKGIFNNVPVNGYNERPRGGKAGKDWFGVTWTYEEGDPAPMPSQDHLLEDICDWREVVVFPDLDAIDWEEAAGIDRIGSLDTENGLHSQMIHNGVFERLNTLMGMENSLCSLLTDPDECKEFFDACADFKCRLISKIHKYYHPDIICYHDDWGSQQTMLFSPDIWRELIMPATKKICEHTKSLGMFFQLHSDGMIKDIIPDIMEEIKPDSIQLMTINDIPALLELTGNNIAYDVFDDVQLVAQLDGNGSLSEDVLRAEMKEDFEVLAKGCCMANHYMLPAKWKDVILEEFDKVNDSLIKKLS